MHSARTIAAATAAFALLLGACSGDTPESGTATESTVTESPATETTGTETGSTGAGTDPELTDDGTDSAPTETGPGADPGGSAEKPDLPEGPPYQIRAAALDDESLLFPPVEGYAKTGFAGALAYTTEGGTERTFDVLPVQRRFDEERADLENYPDHVVAGEGRIVCMPAVTDPPMQAGCRVASPLVPAVMIVAGVGDDAPVEELVAFAEAWLAAVQEWWGTEPGFQPQPMTDAVMPEMPGFVGREGPFGGSYVYGSEAADTEVLAQLSLGHSIEKYIADSAIFPEAQIEVIDNGRGACIWSDMLDSCRLETDDFGQIELAHFGDPGMEFDEMVAFTTALAEAVPFTP